MRTTGPGRRARHYGSDVVGHSTGRHQAGSGCGRRGPELDPDAPNRWPGEADLRGSPLALPEDLEDALMAAWDEHADRVAAELDALGAVAAWSDQVRIATTQLEKAVAKARSTGQTWEEIGGALGASRQVAWRRYRHLDPPETGAGR